VSTIRDWLEQHAPRLIAVYDWLCLRATGSRCYAQGCGRLVLLHTPRQLNRCYSTPLAIVITEQGYARAVVAEAEKITRAATS
jgi:hypothetical protein